MIGAWLLDMICDAESIDMEPGRSLSHWWPTLGVMLGALTVALNIGVLNIAIPSMMSNLGTDLDRIQWVQTGYQIAQVIMIPAIGWLGAQLGTKRLFRDYQDL